MNRKKVCIIIAIFFFLVALGITLYPIISTWYNARHQSQLHSQYQEQMQHVDTDRLQKEREKAITKEKQIVFLMQIGGKLKSGKPHDGRAPDYDDWSLNGDILVYSDVLEDVIEISSMGIRVDAETLDSQLKIADKNTKYY